MEGKEAYEKFRDSRQEALRLQLALQEFVRIQSLGNNMMTSEEARWEKTYREYLDRRRIPAAEALIRSGNLKGLRILYKEGFLDEKYLNDYRKLASREKQIQIQWWLLYGWKQEDKIRSETVSKQIIAEKIWNLTQKKAILEFPYMASSFCKLRRKEEKNIYTFGTDGETFFYCTDWTEKTYKEQDSAFVRMYFHMILHCLYLHVFVQEKTTEEEQIFRNLSCDIFVEYLLDRKLFHAEENIIRRKIYTVIERKRAVFHWNDITSLLKKMDLSRVEIEELYEEFCVDNHMNWYRLAYDDARSRVTAENADKKMQRKNQISWLKNRRKQMESWKKDGEVSVFQSQQQEGKMGASGGYQEEYFALKQEKKYDYGTFLRRFSVFGEEVQTDWEQFDYIPYSYSRSHYEKLVFLEPLEYTEVYKLQELVIAIDTSGSCRGSIVRQFLEETYQILSGRENFFKKMRVHIIQCDSMIQGYVCIENEEQWKAYGRNPKVQGFGGTDFRPVFEYVEQLHLEKKIQNLKGLIYFTDGDGIFPEKAPDYETAFVFLNQSLEKQEVPKWAVKLNLNLSIEDDFDKI